MECLIFPSLGLWVLLCEFISIICLFYHGSNLFPVIVQFENLGLLDVGFVNVFVQNLFFQNPSGILKAKKVRLRLIRPAINFCLHI